MSATLDEKIIAKEILIKLIETGNLSYDEFPEVKGTVDLACASFKKILDTISQD